MWNSACKENFTRQNVCKQAVSAQSKSAITDHSLLLNHIMNWMDSRVLTTKTNQGGRHIKESIWIRKATNTINREKGAHQLRLMYDPFLTKAPSRGQHRRKLGSLPSLWWWSSTKLMAETVRLVKGLLDLSGRMLVAIPERSSIM